MRYRTFDTSATQLSGSPAYLRNVFTPWQPSTWPEAPAVFDEDFYNIIEKIFKVTIIDEIDNVINDAKIVSGSLEHRGHVVAIVQFCAIDTLSSYAYFDESAEKCRLCNRSDSKVNKFKKFVTEFFPDEYKRCSEELYKSYRNAMVHSWNLFEVGISPNEEELKNENGDLSFGLNNFQSALKTSLENFLERLKTDGQLQKNTIGRYKELKKSARK